MPEKEKSENNVAVLKIGSREIPLRCTMLELADIEEQIGPLDSLKDLFLKGKRRVRNMAQAFTIMGNAGLKESGQAADLTAEWFLDNMEPGKLQGYQAVLIGVFLSKLGQESEPEEDGNGSGE